MLSVDELKATGQQYLDILVGWALSPQFYVQVGAIVLGVLLARIAASQLRKQVAFLCEAPAQDQVVSRIFRTFFQATAPWVGDLSSNSGFMSMYFRVAHLPAAMCLSRAAARLRHD